MPDGTVLRFTDPYEYQAAVRAAELNVFVTSPGDYRAELTRIDLHRLWMQRSRFTLPQIAHSAVTTDRNVIFFLANVHQKPMYHSGRELIAGDIIFNSSGAEHYHRGLAGCHWGAMSLAPDDLAAAGRDLAGYDLAAPAVTRLIRPPPHLMLRLLHLHEAAGHLAATVPDVLAHPEVARAMEQELVRVMIGCLTSGMTIGSDGARQRAPVMRWFERVLEAHADRPLYVTEVCAAIGVSERTLRLHCLEHLGMGPHRYLWLRRMNFARRALARADPVATTVTVVATDHGFGELGRFAVAYRKLFGESPSVTLRRAPDQRPIVR